MDNVIIRFRNVPHIRANNLNSNSSGKIYNIKASKTKESIFQTFLFLIILFTTYHWNNFFINLIFLA